MIILFLIIIIIEGVLRSNFTNKLSNFNCVAHKLFFISYYSDIWGLN